MLSMPAITPCPAKHRAANSTTVSYWLWVPAQTRWQRIVAGAPHSLPINSLEMGASTSVMA